MPTGTTHRKRSPKSPNGRAQRSGTLMIIGGREDRAGGMRILTNLARLTGRGRLVVASAATEEPKEAFREYKKIFKSLGVENIDHLQLESFEDARTEAHRKMIENAQTVFFTGGDQLRITTKLGGSPLVDALFALFARGGTVAGTSAGAAIMGETMLVGGASNDITESHKIGNWMMAPGLGLLKNIIVDQHFGQRARIGRLLGAVALNPRVLGVGIDEDTAIVVQDDRLSVLGTNAVYVVDGHDVTFTNIAETDADRTMSMHDVRMHILSDGETFDMRTRRPDIKRAIKAAHSPAPVPIELEGKTLN